MTLILPAASLFLLQGPQLTDFQIEADPRDLIILLAVIVGIIAAAILYKFFTKGSSGTLTKKLSAKGGRAPLAPRKFGAFTLYRIASAYGLNGSQKKMLDFVFRNDGVVDPNRVMDNTQLMDRHFKRAYRAIEKNSANDDDAQRRLVSFFSLRNVIEASSGLSDSQTPRLSENTPTVLVFDKDSYTVKVISSRAQNVVTEIPRNSLGSPVRVGKGTKVSLSFFTKSSEGFSLSGQVVGPLETDRGEGLQISHSGKLKRLVKRAHRRRQVSIKCEMVIVNFQGGGDGKKSPPRMVPDSRKFTGSLVDISAGGCALKTSAPIQAGTMLKISIDYDMAHYLHVLGRVLRTNRSVATGNILHIKFLKVPLRAYNSISALAYGYVDL